MSAITSGIVTRDREHVGAVDRRRRISEDRLVLVDQVRHAGRRAAAPEQPDVLEDEREADRGDQRRELRRVAKRPVADPLDEDVQAAGRRPSQTISVSEQPEHQPERPGREARPERAPEADDVNEPIMNTSPWAKLISSMIP